MASLNSLQTSEIKPPTVKIVFLHEAEKPVAIMAQTLREHSLPIFPVDALSAGLEPRHTAEQFRSILNQIGELPFVVDFLH